MVTRTENYYEQFGREIGEVVKYYDLNIKLMTKLVEESKSNKKDILDNFAKQYSNYVIGQQLSETVRVDDIVWSDSWSQISLIVFNDNYGVDNILESELENYLKHL